MRFVCGHIERKKNSPEKGSRSTLESVMTALEYEMIVAELKACEGNMAAASRNLDER